MEKHSLKYDRRNYRRHDDANKKIIKKSLEECGAGRSILADSTGEIIAGNGVFEQAEKQGIKIKTIETDGSELVVVVRKDLKPGDKKRKLLALADNAASDSSSWNEELVRKDWGENIISEWGMPGHIWGQNPPLRGMELQQGTMVQRTSNCQKKRKGVLQRCAGRHQFHIGWV